MIVSGRHIICVDECRPFFLSDHRRNAHGGYAENEREDEIPAGRSDERMYETFAGGKDHSKRDYGNMRNDKTNFLPEFSG